MLPANRFRSDCLDFMASQLTVHYRTWTKLTWTRRAFPIDDRQYGFCCGNTDERFVEVPGQAPLESGLTPDLLDVGTGPAYWMPRFRAASSALDLLIDRRRLGAILG